MVEQEDLDDEEMVQIFDHLNIGDDNITKDKNEIHNETTSLKKNNRKRPFNTLKPKLAQNKRLEDFGKFN
ncbi:4786_t:CDS:2 [Entrophospora sp. SA101]|nr:4786_t:CDS:2 [Entrophospora sp. SA101]